MAFRKRANLSTYEAKGNDYNDYSSSIMDYMKIFKTDMKYRKKKNSV